MSFSAPTSFLYVADELSSAIDSISEDCFYAGEALIFFLLQFLIRQINKAAETFLIDFSSAALVTFKSQVLLLLRRTLLACFQSLRIADVTSWNFRF